MNETALREQLRKDILARITPCKAVHSPEGIRVAGCVCGYNDGLRVAADAVSRSPKQQREIVQADFVLLGAPHPSRPGAKMLLAAQGAETELIHEIVGIDTVTFGPTRGARLPVYRHTLFAEFPTFSNIYAADYQAALQSYVEEQVIPASRPGPLALPPRE